MRRTIAILLTLGFVTVVLALLYTKLNSPTTKTTIPVENKTQTAELVQPTQPPKVTLLKSVSIEIAPKITVPAYKKLSCIITDSNFSSDQDTFLSQKGQKLSVEEEIFLVLEASCSAQTNFEAFLQGPAGSQLYKYSTPIITGWSSFSLGNYFPTGKYLLTFFDSKGRQQTSFQVEK